MYAQFTYATFGSHKLQMFSGDMKLGEVDKLMLIYNISNDSLVKFAQLSSGSFALVPLYFPSPTVQSVSGIWIT